MAVYYAECRLNLSAVFDGFGGPDSPVVIPDIIPLTADINCNSYKEADTWEVTFDLKRFPFSPELLRSAAIEIYLYQRPNLTEPFEWNQEQHLTVTGLVDNVSLTQDETGGVIAMSGRDYTALLLDREWHPRESGKRGRVPDGPLDQVVQQLVDEAVNAETIGRTLTVRFLDYDTSAPSTADVRNSAVITKKKVTKKPPPTTKSRSKRKKRGIAVKSDSSYWDVIYKLCTAYGFIVYVRGFDVIITRPHVLQAEAQNYYRVAYGRNLEKLEVERKLAKDAVPQIRVRSYDSVGKTILEARYPEGKQQVLTGVGTKKEEYRVFTIPDVTDENTLKDCAKAAYYRLARGEGAIRFTTPHLRDIPRPIAAVAARAASAAFPLLKPLPEVDGALDMLRMRAGDAVMIVWDAFNSEVMLDAEIGAEQKMAALISLGYSSDVAALVVQQYAKLDYFRQPFYVKAVGFHFSSDQGVSIEVEAQNFINPERDGVDE